MNSAAVRLAFKASNGRCSGGVIVSSTSGDRHVKRRGSRRSRGSGRDGAAGLSPRLKPPAVRATTILTGELSPKLEDAACSTSGRGVGTTNLERELALQHLEKCAIQVLDGKVSSSISSKLWRLTMEENWSKSANSSRFHFSTVAPSARRQKSRRSVAAKATSTNAAAPARVLCKRRQRRWHGAAVRQSTMPNSNRKDERLVEEADLDVTEKKQSMLLASLRKQLAKGRKVGRRTIGNSNDATSDWLRHLGNTPLLTKSQEFELANMVQAGLEVQEGMSELAAELGREPSAEELREALGDRREVVRRLARMEEARSLMVQYNLRFVFSVAKKFKEKGVPLSDLIPEGTAGLIKAINKFDPGKGFRFSTYAFWWVQQAISRCVCNESRVVRVPVHVYEWHGKILRVTEQLSVQPERLMPPTDEEVGLVLGLTGEKVAQYRAAMRPLLSLDAHVKTGSAGISEQREVTLLETLSDESEECFEEIEQRKQLIKEDVDTILNTLHPRERNVLRMRYGLHNIDEDNMTCSRIGSAYGLTPERIRQIEDKALRKLQRPWRQGLLRAHLYSVNS